jgi:crossover junction endodeoxyribonuclease RuvC
LPEVGTDAELVLGIDPGLQITGYGLIRSRKDRLTLVEMGTISGGCPRSLLPARLSFLFDGMRSVVREYRPSCVAVEQLYSHYAHPRTAILMAHARGVLCLAAALEGIKVFDYSATEVKSSLTGNGRASKQQMQRMVARVLRLDEEPYPLDISDALSLALCHAYRTHGSR